MHTWISSLGQSGNLQNSGDWTISEIDHIADTVEDNAGFSPGVHDIAYFYAPFHVNLYQDQKSLYQKRNQRFPIQNASTGAYVRTTRKNLALRF